MVEEAVLVSHFDLARVKALVSAHPALAGGSMDWGFGDWEDCLGAASHTGRYDIAELLIANGARPTIFSAAMMGQLDTVRAFVNASPGIQRVLGPHSFTLLAHARAGGERARSTLTYLQALGDADAAPETVPLPTSLRDAYAGTYTFGDLPADRLIVAVDRSGGLTINRPGLPFPRNLRHLGDHAFHPVGAEHVRIRFTLSSDRASELIVFDPTPVVTATRSES